MESFQDLFESTKPTQKYMKTDWSVEEKQFKESIPAFLEGISVGNVVVDISVRLSDEEKLQNSSQKIDTKEVIAGEGIKNNPIPIVEEKDKEKSINVQEHTPITVESHNVKGPKEGPSIILPLLPKEKDLDSTDAFDDLFGSSEPTQKTTQKPKVEQKPVVATTKDVFDSISDSPATKENPVVAASSDKNLPGMDLESFDLEAFEDVKKVIKEMMSKAVPINIDELDKVLATGGYNVPLTIDPYREDPVALAEFIAKIQAQKDSIHANLVAISVWNDAYDAAEHYLRDVGVCYSVASSREKRLAQVMFVMKDFYIGKAKVSSLHTKYQREFNKLCGQMEAISRLVTCLQQRNKISDAPRHTLPFDPDPPKKVMEKMSSHELEPRKPVAQVSTPPKEYTGKRKVDSLDNFEATKVPVASKFTSGEVDF